MCFIRASLSAFKEQHFVSTFFTNLRSVRTALLFMYIDLVTKMSFRSLIYSFLLTVWFCIFLTCVVDNPEIAA